MTAKPRHLAVVRPLPATTDADALARVARGDVGALGEVYDRHARALLSFASRAAGRSEAEDIVQSTFLRAAKVAATYDDRAPTARAWLFGITVRLLQERRRSVARLARALLRFDASDAIVPHDGDRCDLENGLARLADAKRTVLLLAEVEGFTCEEIAVIVGVPVGTVWTRLHHARKELRAFFDEESR
jgi:RNA polymerase sigma-70 factor (ECF subfamily)